MVIESVGAEFCPYHLRLAEEHGAEAVMAGTVPKSKERVLRVVPAEVAQTPTSSGSGRLAIVADPASVRPSLAAAAAENVEQLKTSLLEAASSAVKPVWLTVECTGCGERSRVEAPVPDVRARVAAIELLLREGLGRPASAEEVRAPRMPATVAAVKALGWEEMQYLFAATFVDEVAALQRAGGEALVREKLAALSEDERRLLREALAA